MIIDTQQQLKVYRAKNYFYLIKIYVWKEGNILKNLNDPQAEKIDKKHFSQK